MGKGSTPKTYKFGAALSGGGVRGFAHLGALKAMNERGLYPDVISGTSAGSLAGAFYADGYTPDEIYSIFRSIKFRELIVTAIPHDGLFRSTGFQAFVEKHLKARKFEDLKIPLRVVASDIEQGIPHVFSKGNIIPAIIASCSVPIVLTPVEIDNHHYVDGGMFMNFPVSIIRKECERVIGVDISPIITMKYDRSFKYIIERTMNYMVGANTLEERKACDFLIESSDISAFSLFDIKSADTIYEKGYEVAVTYLDQNKERLNSDFSEPKPMSILDKISKLVKAGK